MQHHAAALVESRKKINKNETKRLAIQILACIVRHLIWQAMLCLLQNSIIPLVTLGYSPLQIAVRITRISAFGKSQARDA